MDRSIGMGALLRPDVDYDRPRGGGDALFELVGDLVGDLAGKRILDFGCGIGTYRAALERSGARWVGVDLTGREPTAHAEGGRLPFRDGAFDLVFCTSVLEHLPEPDAALDEMRRVLAEGGILFGYVAFLEPFHGLSYFHMSHMGLEYLLLKHGFRPTRIYPSHAALAYHLEGMLFPKPVPVIQAAARRIFRWKAQAILGMNRAAREVLSILRGKPGPERKTERGQYRRLLAMRYAIGFNFIAVRGQVPVRGPSGYAALVREG